MKSENSLIISPRTNPTYLPVVAIRIITIICTLIIWLFIAGIEVQAETSGTVGENHICSEIYPGI